VLLVALAQSSCYWQPVPSQNIYASLSGVVPVDDPPLMGSIHLIDRCWCDLSLHNFFQPFNVTQWERMSLEREKSVRTGFRRDKSPEPEAGTSEVVTESDVHEDAEEPSTTFNVSLRTRGMIDSIGSWWGIWDHRSQHTAAGDEDEHVSGKVEEIRSGTEAPVSSPIPGPATTPLLPRHQYDLRPYGVGLILDFGWGRSA